MDPASARTQGDVRELIDYHRPVVTQDMVYVVLASGVMLGVYTRPELARMHMSTITGAVVFPTSLRDQLPQRVIDEMRDDFDEDPTPVTKPFMRV